MRRPVESGGRLQQRGWKEDQSTLGSWSGGLLCGGLGTTIVGDQHQQSNLDLDLDQEAKLVVIFASFDSFEIEPGSLTVLHSSSGIS